MKIWILFFVCLSLCQVSRSIMNPILMQYKKSTLQLREDNYQNNLPIFDSYDYVIVGAGPSGCVLANRLTEDPDVTVLLLEAGPETTVYNDIPIDNFLLFDTDYNWKFSSQYNPGVCRSMNRETCPWPSGKGIGGGTALNALIYTRGNKRDFDNWAKEGNTGWAYKDVLKYFVKLENTRIPEMRNSPLRGRDGPLWVSHSPYKSNASLTFIDAGREMGYPIIDYNQPYTSGFGRTQLSLKDGFRSSASNAYLKPVTRRRNLHVAQRTMVTKIVIDPTEKIARGVEFYKKNEKRVVSAKKEVILSAGAFGSPKLLMLSGIGPKQHLESLNIDVIKDLPVGNNLQEHLGLMSAVFITNQSSNFLVDLRTFILQLPIAIIKHQITRDGLPSIGGVESLAYVSSRYSTDENPDIELLFVGASQSTDHGYILRNTMGIRDDVYNSYYKPLEKEACFGIWVMGCYPKSRGTVRLASSDPLASPVINNNFLSETEDLDVLIDGVKKTIAISETEAMKAYGVRIHRRSLPGCENMEFGTDEYWACSVRQITSQLHHQSGTCKMGPDGDPSAVLDPRLRVRGIDRLRVVDVSIMPTITAGHTQSPAYMIGEKAADMIKEDNKR